MKNRALILMALVVTTCAAVFLTGCATESTVSATNSIQNLGTFGEVVIPVKDFESKGLVFTQMEFNTDPNGTIKGNIFTYQALLKEAQKVGADAIINVVIDRRIETTKRVNVSEYGGTSVTETKKETWYGSALAIRYTNALLQAQMTQGPLTVSGTRERNFNDGVSPSSEQAGQIPAGQNPAKNPLIKNAPAGNANAGKGFFR